MRLKLVLLIILIIFVVGAIAHLAWKKYQESQTSNNGIQIVASFYPLAEFARQVGGNVVDVTTVVPANSEPHEYEPTPQELARVYAAAMFIYNGNGFDPWAERIAPELKEKGVRVINMSETMPPLSATPDPHFWLNPVLAQKQVDVIRKALIAIDPAHAREYTANSEAYNKQLQKLDQDYRSRLTMCARRDIVTSHAAFGYLAQEYNLSVITIAGLSPEEEPSARIISEIATVAQEKNIKYIFFETLVSPRLAQTVAFEIGAKTLIFNPLEGLTDEQQQAGKDYLALMRDNLQNLQIAMECN